MTWWKVDDGFHSHPKVSLLFDADNPADAIALWTLAGSWCARELTEGFIPTAQTRRFGLERTREAAAELVRVGLWEQVEGGFRFHDWLDRNPSRETVLAERAKGVARKQASRARLARDQPETKRMSRPSLAGVSPVSRDGLAFPVPDPDPGPSLLNESNSHPSLTGELSVARARAESPPAPWSEGSTHFRVRKAFESRYLEVEASPPNQRSLSQAVSTLAPWVEQTALARKMPVDAVIAKLMTGFFADANAHSKHFPPGFLANGPLEYFDPRPAVAKVAANSGRYAGPSAVGKPEDYAASENDPW